MWSRNLSFYNGNFAKHKKDTFDYIVTTTELDLDTKTPVIFMDEVFDREYIQKKFENIKYLSDAGRNIRRGIDSLFMNLLDEKDSFSWIRNIHMMKTFVLWQKH